MKPQHFPKFPKTLQAGEEQDFFGLKGLSDAEVQQARKRYGTNELRFKKSSGFWLSIIDFLKEPMAILLFAAATIYFISKEIADGFFMVGAILLVGAISIYQDSRSRKALNALESLTRTQAKVLRNGQLQEVLPEEIVIGDHMVVREGNPIPADGRILRSHDFAVDESILTGESFPVQKTEAGPDDQIYRGTVVNGGLAIAEVNAIGKESKLGKLGGTLEQVVVEKTPLQIQINSFIRVMAIWGTVVFLLVWGINFLNTRELLDSLLKALTLAMSILPEEIPVAFTTFMALGSWRLMKMGVIVKRISTVETLGSATVICADKTGTITENKMALDSIYLWSEKKLGKAEELQGEAAENLITYAMWASEPIPFDPMETAIHSLYGKVAGEDLRPEYKLVHEYPLGGRPPMMTHVFQSSKGHLRIAVKGAPEAVIQHSTLTEEEQMELHLVLEKLTKQGYRVLGVGMAERSLDALPNEQDDFTFDFLGLLAFYDPPKSNIREVFNALYDAGLKVKIITGDNAATTAKIAREVGFRDYNMAINGEDLTDLSEEELRNVVREKKIFSRMFPEAKLRVIEALKKDGEIVAMTGDGVNDGPALKSAHIGIAMGSRGTEVAKEASALILTENDLSGMVDAIAMGRRIYTNLKKAIQYIISIHVPIILTVFIPLALGWIYPNIFTPVHIIFFEIIMGPTCSIIYENEPIEKFAMKTKPRVFSTTFFERKEIITSIVQGLGITLASLGIYQYAVSSGFDINGTRTMIFLTLISANIWLTLVNRSFYYSILTTFRYKNRLIPLIIGFTIFMTAILLFFPPAMTLFQFSSLGVNAMLVSIVAGFLSVIWFELYKWYKRSKRQENGVSY